MASEVRVGDKYIITIDEVEWSPTKGNRYYVKGFDSLMMTDIGLAKLEKYKEPPKEAPHTCRNCAYEKINEDCYPCSRCDKNGDPQDMFQPKGSIIRG
ncbi:MAG: hypothetical protein U0L88_07035 [Acutalibacteraceae bacterium]|nr:hypothetical protein [Acutalibacteraceae bacterium]